VRALADLQGLVEVLEPRGRIGGFLASPGVRPVDKLAALRKGLEGKVSHIVVLFIELLLRKKRLPEFPLIVPEFQALVERSQGIQRAHAVSAVPFTEAEQSRLHSELERYTQKKIRLTTEVDPRLIGGALVRIGDHVIDRSAATLLRTIQEQLAAVSV
jgi:F-type H+-transporting ATPase subunit delta